MAAPAASILLTGNELLRGVIADRNASFLARRLEALGLSLRRTLTVGDGLDDIEAGLGLLLDDADLVVTSGGLGPTHDDRTVEAIARVARADLVTDEAVLARIEAFSDDVARRTGFDRSRFIAGNRKQARIPAGASVLGMAGTAPGLVLEVRGAVVVVLPGVPSELRRLWHLAPEHPLLAPILERARPRRRLLVRTYGIGESHVGDLFAEAGGDPPGVETSICARNYEVEIDIRAAPDAGAAAEGLQRRLLDALGDRAFTTDDRSPAEIVLDALGERGWTLATAESCTGGMVGAEITAVPGSSEAFLGSVVAYSDGVKGRLLGVPEATLRDHGAVSAETAEAMAEGARTTLGADVAVSVTGVAGPGGGTDVKPVGLVYLHVASPAGGQGIELRAGGGRADVRARAAAAALHLVRAHIGAVPAPARA